MSEADQKAQEQAERMKDWFQGREVPKQIQIGRHETYEDTAKYIQTALATMEHVEVNSTHFRAAYFRLYNLKKALENQ